MQFGGGGNSPLQFLESFLKLLSVTLSCLLVSVSGSKSVKADISITYSNDDSSCKSGENALTPTHGKTFNKDS